MVFNSAITALYMLVECWNLSPLKPVIPPFCLSEKLTGIDIHFLNAASAFYIIISGIFYFLLYRTECKEQ